MGSRNTPVRRRALSAVSVVAIAFGGVAWSGCGKSDQEKAQDAVSKALDNANEQSSRIQDQVDQAIEDSNIDQSDVDQAVQDAKDQAAQSSEDAKQQAQDIQKEIQDQIDQASGN
ncbi:hypothetical protein BH10ACT11_BH10ACT11_07840 [soil metagenome]